MTCLDDNCTRRILDEAEVTDQCCHLGTGHEFEQNEHVEKDEHVLRLIECIEHVENNELVLR